MRFLATGLLSLLVASTANANHHRPSTPGSSKDKRSVLQLGGTKFNVFEHAATGSKLQYVHNSGVCETTPGVNQYSGYLTPEPGMNMWFWFFEARNNASTAPLAAWFNGGPGCSSMIGLFQENGPCHFVNGEKEPSLNPHSWNNDVNMVYIDEPIGAGFSYGADAVDSTKTAAPYVWKFLQAFYAQFPQYESRDFAIFTESYGGHYGPEFAHYVEQQNAAIKSGSVQGEHIDLVALGINNGWYNASPQEKAYIDFSYDNTYRRLITTKEKEKYENAYHNNCLPAIQKCHQSRSVVDCANADQTCSQDIENPIINGANFDVYDIRQPYNDPYPPETYVTYLHKPEVMQKIGAQSRYTECSNPAYAQFAATGDSSRTFVPELSKVVQSGITVLLWAGDADWICNWKGGIAAAQEVKYPGQKEFQSKHLEPYTVDGKQMGTFKGVDNFSFLRVFEAGHEVPYYQPKVAQQVFSQTMHKKPIFST